LDQAQPIWTGPHFVVSEKNQFLGENGREKPKKKNIYMSHKIVHHKWGRRISLNSPMHMQECPIYPSVFSSDFPCHLNARRSEWFIFKPAQVCHKLESSKKKIDAMVCWKI
jgi:hypothetical protein